jgi:trigger factor
VEYVEETSVRKSLAFEVEPEVLEQEIDVRARDYARKVRLPGFRPGKVPPGVVRQRYRGLVLEESLEAVVNRIVPPELEGRGLRPLASPRVADLKHGEGQALTFRVVFETLPLFELPEWRGLEARTRRPQVPDEAVDKELEGLRERNASFQAVEGRAAQAGDFCVVDLAWRAEGRPDGREENTLVEVGGGQTARQVSEALQGALPGDVREADVDGQEGEDAPRQVHYTITLKAIKTKSLPALDDEFAKDLGDFETLADLRADLRRRLEQADERRLDREVKQALVEAFTQRASFEVPETLIERHMTAQAERAARALAMQGVDPAKTGIDWQQYRAAQREPALAAAKAEVLLDELARREGVTVLESDLEVEIARYAQALRKSKSAMRAQLEKDGELEHMRARIREDKTLDLLKANARLIFE